MKRLLMALGVALFCTASVCAKTLNSEIPFKYKGVVGGGLYDYSVYQNKVSGLCYVRNGGFTEVPCESVYVLDLKEQQLKTYKERRRKLEETIKNLQEQLNNMRSE